MLAKVGVHHYNGSKLLPQWFSYWFCILVWWVLVLFLFLDCYHLLQTKFMLLITLSIFSVCWIKSCCDWFLDISVAKSCPRLRPFLHLNPISFWWIITLHVCGDIELNKSARLQHKFELRWHLTNIGCVCSWSFAFLCLFYSSWKFFVSSYSLVYYFWGWWK